KGEPLRHRQTKEAANRYVQPTATAPHLDSTPSRTARWTTRCLYLGRCDIARAGYDDGLRPCAVLAGIQRSQSGTGCRAGKAAHDRAGPAAPYLGLGLRI